MTSASKAIARIPRIVVGCCLAVSEDALIEEARVVAAAAPRKSRRFIFINLIQHLVHACPDETGSQSLAVPRRPRRGSTSKPDRASRVHILAARIERLLR